MGGGEARLSFGCLSAFSLATVSRARFSNLLTRQLLRGPLGRRGEAALVEERASGEELRAEGRGGREGRRGGG